MFPNSNRILDKHDLKGSILHITAIVAQSVEHRSYEPDVVSSSLTDCIIIYGSMVIYNLYFDNR